MNYQIRLPLFEGPFDLLLHLIREHEIDIYDIPIALITEQYLAYLQAMDELDLETASAFIVMAATLLAIKAKMLLPKSVLMDENSQEEDARTELVHDLLEYIRFKEAADTLAVLADAESRYISRPNQESLLAELISRHNPVEGKTLDDLFDAFIAVLLRLKEEGQTLTIEREQITIADKLEQLYQAVKLAGERGISFEELFSVAKNRQELIIGFLALLELARQGVVRTSQSKRYSNIYIYAADLEAYQVFTLMEGAS